MSVWDQYADFLAKEAAYLATENEFDSVGLLKLMRDAYEKAKHETYIKYELISDPARMVLYGRNGAVIPNRYQSVNDPLPVDALYSSVLMGHIQEIFDFEDDSDLHNAFIEHYKSWRNNNSSSYHGASCHFDLQRFKRKEIDRWLNLRGIESKYAFVQNNTTSMLSQGNELKSIEAIDTSVLAAPYELIAIFEKRGLDKQWFNDLKNHSWLKVARKTKGRGGKNPILPLYCPYEVMVGLRTDSRAAKNRYTEETGWRLLRENFPRAYSRFEHLEPDFDQSENGH
jgi:hypothetical protein